MDLKWEKEKDIAVETPEKGLDVGIAWEHEPIARDGATYGRVGKVGQILRQQVYDCPFCKGTGLRPASSKCPVCKGRGTVRVQPPAVICAYCKGRGEETPRSALTCSVCKGKGVVRVKEPIKICPNCRGRGKPRGAGLYCLTCRGTGVVTVKTRKEGDGYVRRPSGSEWEALQIIHELGRAGRHTVGGKMHVSTAYADYVCKSLLKKGLIEKESRDVYVLSESAKLIFEKRDKERPKESKEAEKMKAKRAEEAKEKSIDPTRLMEYKIP